MRTAILVTLGILGEILLTVVGFYFILPHQPQQKTVIVQQVDDQQERKAFFQATKIYGRAGCGDINLADMTAKRSLKSGVPAEIIAAVVATESSCNPLAISNKKAVGLLQVVPAAWASQYDFGKINLLNPEQNLQVGTEILSGLIKKYGLREGIKHYNGAGAETDIYADRILKLSKGN